MSHYDEQRDKFYQSYECIPVEDQIKNSVWLAAHTQLEFIKHLNPGLNGKVKNNLAELYANWALRKYRNASN